MEYFVKRGEQRYGPYSLSDLQKYVESGNVAVDDLAQSESMTDWLPVSQILGSIPVTPTGLQAVTTTIAQPELVPLPPNLHWAILLVLNLLSRQLFNLLWALIQGNWARRLCGDNKPLVLVAMYPAGIIAGILTIALNRHNPSMAALGGLFIIAGAIIYLFGMFAIKHAMEEYYTTTENAGMYLSGVMVFFFSTVYIQYHINKLARWKRLGFTSDVYQ